METELTGSAYPWFEPLTDEALSTRRGFVFQYPPFPVWGRFEVDALVGQGWPPAPVGLYVHLPDCAYKCAYCYHVTAVGREKDEMDAYVGLVLAEIDLLLSQRGVQRPEIETMYFGGGTPTFLGAPQLNRLMEGASDRFDVTPTVECTFESDPTTITYEKLRVLVAHGVSRLSIGVQTFNDELNRRHRRMHSAADSLRAIDTARRAGIRNVNIDLICGLPGETAATWTSTVRQLISVQPEHITVYLLSVRPKTAVYGHAETDIERDRIPGEPQRIDWFRQARDEFLTHGFEQTSTNCFVRSPEFEQIHQRNVWSCHPMFGFGVSAYSYADGCVFENASRIADYVRAIQEGRLAVHAGHRLTTTEKAIRYVILRLKLLRVSRVEFREAFGADVVEMFAEVLFQLEGLGLVVISQEDVSLTAKGIIYVDDVCRAFYTPEHKRHLASLDKSDKLVDSLI
jgi:oxygen-independent coproporphyrinogen-3 oxidase